MTWIASSSKSILKWIGGLLVFAAVLSLESCGPRPEFEGFQQLPGAMWHQDSILTFTMPSSDTISRHNLFLELRNTGDYPYSNIYFFIDVHFPNGVYLQDTVQYMMTDLEGNWLGKGISDLKESVLEYKSNVTFPERGDYQFKVRHGMRKEVLPGIADFGIRVEKVEQ